jgi:hypothetical protein
MRVIPIKIGTQIGTQDLVRINIYERVGCGEQTSGRCGQFLGFIGCLNVDLHNHSTLDGVDHSNKVFAKRVFHSCDRPECKVCFKRGWAPREAGKAESRLKEASNRFGVAEHIIDSVPMSDYGLPFEKLKDNSLKAMRARHYIGGIMIFHAERFANIAEASRKGIPAGWRYSPHFHYLGFLDGGYGSCRDCSKPVSECWGCKGFEGLTRRLNVTDGHIVKVKGARKTIFGTLWYQMNHMTLVRGGKRSRTVVWNGVCSYRKLHLKKEDRIKRDVCPICGHDLVPVKYVGEGEPDGGQWWLSEFEDSYLDERGVPKWILKPKVKSYE